MFRCFFFVFSTFLYHFLRSRLSLSPARPPSHVVLPVPICLLFYLPICPSLPSRCSLSLQTLKKPFVFTPIGASPVTRLLLEPLTWPFFCSTCWDHVLDPVKERPRGLSVIAPVYFYFYLCFVEEHMSQSLYYNTATPPYFSPPRPLLCSLSLSLSLPEPLLTAACYFHCPPTHFFSFFHSLSPGRRKE